MSEGELWVVDFSGDEVDLVIEGAEIAWLVILTLTLLRLRRFSSVVRVILVSNELTVLEAGPAIDVDDGVLLDDNNDLLVGSRVALDLSCDDTLLLLPSSVIDNLLYQNDDGVHILSISAVEMVSSDVIAHERLDLEEEKLLLNELSELLLLSDLLVA